MIIMKLVILGPPGAGKGTQAKKIAEKYKLKHISTGDILRKNVKQETELGKKAKKYMDKGELVPDKIVNRMVEDYLEGESDYILDGYPRKPEQLEFYLNVDRPDLALLIDTSKDELAERITNRRHCPECGADYNLISNPPENDDEKCDECGVKLEQRDDDTLEALENRLEDYNNKTDPMIEKFKEMDLLEKVNGNRGIQEVWEDVQDVLEDYQ